MKSLTIILFLTAILILPQSSAKQDIAAKKTIQQLEKQRISNLFSRLNLYHAKKDYEKTIEVYRQLLNFDIEDEQFKQRTIAAGKNLAITILKEKKSPAETIDLSSEILKKTGNDSVLYYIISLAYKELKENEKSDQFTKKAKEFKSDDINYRFSVADFFFGRRIFDIAESEYDQILQKEEKPTIVTINARLRLAAILFIREQYQRSIENYERAVEFLKKERGVFAVNRRALAYQIAIVYHNFGRHHEIRKDYQKYLDANLKAIEYFPDTPLFSNAVADAYLKLKDYDKSLQYYQESIEADPRVPETYGGIGDLYSAMGEKEKAEENFKKCIGFYQELIEKEPENAGYYNNFAWFYATHDRNLDGAIKLSLKSLELAPDREEYIDTLAELYYRKGDRKKAIEEIKRAIDLKPRHLLYYQNQLKKFQSPYKE